MGAEADGLVGYLDPVSLPSTLWLVIRASVTGMSAEKFALRSIGLNAAVRAPRLTVA